MQHCQRKEAARRIHGLADLRFALEEAFTWQPEELTAKTDKRERRLGVLVAVLTVALVTLGILAWRSHGPETRWWVRSWSRPPVERSF